jgi:prepilin-type N-terminal cleavage/methylation domain-containing protein
MKKKGFTLIELLIVVAISSIFVSIMWEKFNLQKEVIPLPVEQQFLIEKLFTHEGITIYRFFDMHAYRYFASKGAVTWKKQNGSPPHAEIEEMKIETID